MTLGISFYHDCLGNILAAYSHNPSCPGRRRLANSAKNIRPQTLQMVAQYSHQNGEHIQAVMDVLGKRYKQIAAKVVEKFGRERLS